MSTEGGLVILHTVTDILVRPRSGLVFFLAGLALAAFPAAAHEPAWPPARDRRVVAIRSQSDQPVVHGTPGVPVQLVFDSPLGRGTIRLPGARVQRHPAAADTLIVTPSKSLARGRPVPLVVPLAAGTVTVALSVGPEAPDRRVDLVRASAPRLASRQVRVAADENVQRPWVEVELARPWAIRLAAACTVPACRVDVLVRTPLAPEGHLLEVRSSDPVFCAALAP